jgi:hypothetical protein
VGATGFEVGCVVVPEGGREVEGKGTVDRGEERAEDAGEAVAPGETLWARRASKSGIGKTGKGT